jgi:hypothetical protein
MPRYALQSRGAVCPWLDFFSPLLAVGKLGVRIPPLLVVCSNCLLFYIEYFSSCIVYKQAVVTSLHCRFACLFLGDLGMHFHG